MATTENLPKMNLRLHEMVMDRRPGGQDSRFYCLPPFRGDPTHLPRVHAKSGYRFHLVTQGELVGIFDTWGAAKASISGFPGGSNQGYHTRAECVDAWQAMCCLDSEGRGAVTQVEDGEAVRSAGGGAVHSALPSAQQRIVLLRRPAPALPSARPPPATPPRSSQVADPFLSFAIWGGGVISSSPFSKISQPAEQLYQECGEQPDLLLTRSFKHAALFALDTMGTESDDQEKNEQQHELRFLKGFKDAYVKAAKMSLVDAGKMYNDITEEYLKKHGYKLAYEDDLCSDQDVASDVDPDKDMDAIPHEEAALRADYCAEVRTGKIGAWLSSSSSSVVKKTRGRKGKTSGFKDLFDKPELAPPPSRTRPPPGKKAPVQITVHNGAIKEAWEAETAPFQAEVLAALKKEHQIAKEAYTMAVSGVEPSTPEEYQIELLTLWLATRLGMNTSLLLCHPVPERGGAIEMFSIHVGISKGLVPHIWVNLDRAGFEATHKSFQDFTDECFSIEERCSRALNGMAESPPREQGATPTDDVIVGGAENLVPGGGGDADSTGNPVEGGGGGDDGNHGHGHEDNEGDNEEDKEDDWEEDNDPPLRTLHPALLVEIKAMTPEEGNSFPWRLFAMGSYKFQREMTMAKNRALFKEGMGDGPTGFAGIFSDQHLNTSKKAPKKKCAKRRDQLAIPVGCRTRGQARLERLNDNADGGGKEEEGGAADGCISGAPVPEA
ncbi:hypothetical protein DFH07DRAFT_778151 [Mycena maculata]|uniref:Ribonuclease H1 N-terminal domain-containing protein n=1 Tax=Mycena maculata TaxID=230809 RepID=A0AAD7N1B7_9AGAR|nr:hypothetical protein DFH07DRAFT_778151 [Mycena maculata]